MTLVVVEVAWRLLCLQKYRVKYTVDWRTPQSVDMLRLSTAGQWCKSEAGVGASWVISLVLLPVLTRALLAPERVRLGRNYTGLN